MKPIEGRNKEQGGRHVDTSQRPAMTPSAYATESGARRAMKQVPISAEKQVRKEVTSMKYEKPEIRSAPAAVEAVRGGKASSMQSDSFPLQITTVNAYEADE